MPQPSEINPFDWTKLVNEENVKGAGQAIYDIWNGY